MNDTRSTWTRLGACGSLGVCVCVRSVRTQVPQLLEGLNLLWRLLVCQRADSMRWPLPCLYVCVNVCVCVADKQCGGGGQGMLPPINHLVLGKAPVCPLPSLPLLAVAVSLQPSSFLYQSLPDPCFCLRHQKSTIMMSLMSGGTPT